MALEKNSCSFKGRTDPNRAEVAARGRICECVNGEWFGVILVSGI